MPQWPEHQVQELSLSAHELEAFDKLEVAHLLHLTTPISAAGIALLILDHADPRLPPHAEPIRVPAMSATTGEPMLVTAALLQLGTQTVSRRVPVESFALEEIQTRALKVIAYKDEWPSQWAGFIQHPVKAVFEHHIMQHEAFPQTEHNPGCLG